MNYERIQKAVMLDTELKRVYGLSCDNKILQKLIYGHELSLNAEQQKTIDILKESLKYRKGQLKNELEEL